MPSTTIPHGPNFRRRLRRRPGATLLGVLLAGVLVLTACGDDGSSADPAATPAANSDEDVAAEDETSPIAHYPLEDGYDSSVDGAPQLQIVGDVELVDDDETSATVAAFGSNSGLALDTSDIISDPDVYTLAFRFRLDTESTRPGAWFKLVDLADRRADAGLYVHEGSFQFYHYPEHAGDAPIGGSGDTTVVLRRNADDEISWFVDGEHQATVDDNDPDYGSTRYGVIDDGILHFFLDDVPSGEMEQSSGQIAWLSVYDRALDDDTIAEL